MYGSYAPGAPNVFIDDAQWRDRWMETQRWYLVTAESSLPRLEKLVSPSQLTRVAASGGKVLLTNHPIPGHGPVTNVYGVTEAKMRQ